MLKLAIITSVRYKAMVEIKEEAAMCDLASYLLALKKAKTQLDQGNIEEAKHCLATAIDLIQLHLQAEK